jgi:hypothetical protein
MTNLSVLKYKPPVITVVLNQLVTKAGYQVGVSTYFTPQPDGNTATLPPTIGVTTASGTGAVPTAAGSAAVGANVASSGGAVKSGSFPSSGFDPATTKTWAEVSGIHDQIGYSFTVNTTFSPGMSSAGATAVLYSDTGSPTWVGTVVPLNGVFTLAPSLFTAGDVLRIRVTPAAPSAHLIGYSNEIPFTSSGVSFKRVSHTNANPSSQTTVSVVGTTNYVWFESSPRDLQSASKLFRMHKTTEVVEQVSNISTVNTDNVVVLGTIGDTVFFLANNTSAGQKLFSITESLTLTQVSNIRNAQLTTDAIQAVIPTANLDTLQEGTGCLLFNSNLYFTATNATNGVKMFRVDAAGTIVQVTNTRGNQATSDTTAASAIVFNGAIFAVLNNANGVGKLYKITSADVVTAIGDTRNNSAASDVITLRRATTNFLYYTAQNSSSQIKLYRVNTSDVPAQIGNLQNTQATAESYSGSNTTFAVFNDKLYFFATYAVAGVTNAGGQKLFMLDDAGTLSNIASPLAKDLDIPTTDSSATMIVAGSVLFISMVGASSTPILFYITTSSSTLVRATQPTVPTSAVGCWNIFCSFTFGGRIFVQATAMVDPSKSAVFEVLPTTFVLRQITAGAFQSNAPISLTSVNSAKGHISGSNMWFVYLAYTGGITFVCKMTLS